jgi:hypothetical protein
MFPSFLSRVCGVSFLCVSILPGSAALAISERPADAQKVLPATAAAVNEGRLVRLPGNTHPSARPEFDRGLVDPQLPMDRMLLVLKRSPQQEAALEGFMARQLDPKSPDFHHWLTPSEFGLQYGPPEQSIELVTGWLQNHGFRIEKVANGRTFIEFSGTAAQVQQAFHTEIHRYVVHGAEHIANSTDPAIPEALTSIVVGIESLHNFFSQPQHHDLGSFRLDRKTGKWTPEKEDAINKPLFGIESGSFELVSPYDFATIYNVAPLWSAGIDGTGQTIAIAGRSDISLADVANFRSAFGLPVKAPEITVNGTDPGVPSADDKSENTLDVEWSGAVAKGATINFVTTASTSTSDGATLSVTYIIDNNLAPVMSFSYGSCELEEGVAGNAANNTRWQQGAAEGITEFVASGDQGSAACDGGQSAPYAAEKGLAVSGTSSTPYDVAVGGTDLNWANNQQATYWNATNAANYSSALGYIPEVPWNDTCASDDVDKLIGTPNGYDEEETCQLILQLGFEGDSLINVAGGTGGVSACTTPSSNTPASCAGGYAKPSWQTGTGVPAANQRYVPDLSLFASNGALNTAYVICDSQSDPCTFSVDTDAMAQGVGGTSVASPAMAGIMALVNQKMGAAQGNANPDFYALAARDNRSSCNANTVTAGNACNFYDITSDNNAVPCTPNSPDCTVHHSGDAVGILNGYTAGVGYDLATGLGSVNAQNLVNNWHLVAASPAKAPTATTGAAGSISAATAVVPGAVNPNGSDTHGSFQYATNSALSGAVSTASQDLGAGTAIVNYSAALSGLAADTKYYFRAVASNAAGTTYGATGSFTTSATSGGGGSSQALRFVPVTPCRVADTRAADGPFGGPEPAAGSVTNFLIPQSACAIPSTAVAYSLNVTVVPGGPLGYLTLWPTGQPQPVVSTLNSDGRVKANAAITPAGTNGGVSVYVKDATQVILDINGYFVPAATASALAFYPVTPCRIADTRQAAGSLGGPALAAGSSRVFPILSSACDLPSTAQAYSLNVTALPQTKLGYLTLWPTGKAQPVVSTLNSYTGTVTANAAIVPAGTGGEVSVYVTDAANVILDVDGYFAPPATGGLSLYPTTPCRVVDTRPLSFAGTIGVPVEGSTCAPPSAAEAYVLNATTVPSGELGYLTLWPDGSAAPVVSTLNALDGAVTSNMAIVPTKDGKIDAYADGTTNLILDLSSYFAP